MTMRDHENPDATTLKRLAWNKGKLIGAKPPLRLRHVWSIRAKLQIERRTRDLAMFDLAVDSKLRGCDLVTLKIEDVAPSGYATDRASDGPACRIRVDGADPPSCGRLPEGRRQEAQRIYVSGRRGSAPSITMRQYARLVSEGIASIGLDPHLYSTHSLRRTKASLIYRRTGNLRAVQILLGHTKIESTVRYLGIEVDDALAIAEQVDV
jgi:integrase